jgi:DNA-binding NarL/FixJ family response regulator
MSGDPVRPRRHRVLVVDDASNMRDLLTVLLEVEDDFDVVGAVRDGAQAIERAAELQPDFILLDIAMPGMDGMAALPELRRLVPDSRIVVFSAFEEEELGERAIGHGADVYIEKGTSVTELVDRLRELRRPDEASGTMHA